MLFTRGGARYVVENDGSVRPDRSPYLIVWCCAQCGVLRDGHQAARATICRDCFRANAAARRAAKPPRKPRDALSPRQAETLAFIKQYMADNGYAPSQVEVARNIGVSPGFASQIERALWVKGYLEKARLVLTKKATKRGR